METIFEAKGKMKVTHDPHDKITYFDYEKLFTETASDTNFLHQGLEKYLERLPGIIPMKGVINDHSNAKGTLRPEDTRYINEDFFPRVLKIVGNSDFRIATVLSKSSISNMGNKKWKDVFSAGGVEMKNVASKEEAQAFILGK